MAKDEKITELKKKHNIDEVHVLEIEDKVGYLKKPTKETVSKSFSLIADQDLISAGEIILMDCWLEGDQELIKSEEYYLSSCIQTINLVKIKQGSLVKK
jgi:hypothetical protein